MVMVYEGSALKHLARMGSDGIEPPAGRGVPEAPSGALGGSRQPPSDGRTGPAAEPEGRPETGGSPDPAGPVVTCGFCGRDFVEDRSQATCQACPLSKACGLMRCPHCGYENAKEPGWLTKIREWIR